MRLRCKRKEARVRGGGGGGGAAPDLDPVPAAGLRLPPESPGAEANSPVSPTKGTLAAAGPARLLAEEESY